MWKLWKRSEGVRDRLDSLDKVVDDLATCCSNAHDSIRALDTRVANLDAEISLQWEKVQTGLNRLAGRRRGQGGAETPVAGGPMSVEEINRRIMEGEPL